MHLPARSSGQPCAGHVHSPCRVPSPGPALEPLAKNHWTPHGRFGGAGGARPARSLRVTPGALPATCDEAPSPLAQVASPFLRAPGSSSPRSLSTHRPWGRARFLVYSVTLWVCKWAGPPRPEGPGPPQACRPSSPGRSELSTGVTRPVPPRAESLSGRIVPAQGPRPRPRLRPWPQVTPGRAAFPLPVPSRVHSSCARSASPAASSAAHPPPQRADRPASSLGRSGPARFPMWCPVTGRLSRWSACSLLADGRRGCCRPHFAWHTPGLSSF